MQFWEHHFRARRNGHSIMTFPHPPENGLSSPPFFLGGGSVPADLGEWVPRPGWVAIPSATKKNANINLVLLGSTRPSARDPTSSHVRGKWSCLDARWCHNDRVPLPSPRHQWVWGGGLIPSFKMDILGGQNFPDLKRTFSEFWVQGLRGLGV